MLVTTLERQRAKYRQEDLQKGEWHRALKVACRMLDQNYAPTVIADLAQLSLDEVTQVQTVHTMLGQGIELSGIASQTQLAPDMVEQIYLEESKISSAATSK